MEHDWTDPTRGRYHLNAGKLYTHAFGPPIAIDPDGEDGLALLREASRLAEEVRSLRAGLALVRKLREDDRSFDVAMARSAALKGEIAAELDRLREERDAFEQSAKKYAEVTGALRVDLEILREENERLRAQAAAWEQSLAAAYEDRDAARGLAEHHKRDREALATLYGHNDP